MKLMEFERRMTSVYSIKAKIISFGFWKSIKTLNRRLHWRKRGIVYQHDPRHVDVLVKDLGLEHGNSVQTPATPDVMEEEESEPQSHVLHHRYRSQVLFLSQDRADITFIVNELCQKMSSPNQQSLAKLKRLARYLTRERQWGQVFEYGKNAEELAAFTDTDSDWAGCKETRKSSSAGVLMLGRHALKAYTRKQKVKSSAEAELHAAALGVPEANRVQSMMRDLGFAVKPVLNIVAKAREHILHRQGIGKLKHIDVAYLWVQDEIRSQRLRVRRVRSEEHVADLGTKPLSKTVIAKHCLTLGYVTMNEESA